MIIALFLISLIALTIALGLVALKAPIGYQDEAGFHFGCRNGITVTSNVLSDLSFDPIQASTSDSWHEDETVKTPFILRIPWLKPALGMAALFVLLVSLPMAQRNDETLMVATQNITSEQDETASNNQLETTVAGQRSSKFVQTLCQRFNQVE